VQGKHTPEQIVAKLRQADVELAKGHTIPQVSKQLGIAGQQLGVGRPLLGLHNVPEGGQAARHVGMVAREEPQVHRECGAAQRLGLNQCTAGLEAKCEVAHAARHVGMIAGKEPQRHPQRGAEQRLDLSHQPPAVAVPQPANSGTRCLSLPDVGRSCNL
jgi:hypothetical protein